jgi:hypothetical protein
LIQEPANRNSKTPNNDDYPENCHKDPVKLVKNAKILLKFFLQNERTIEIFRFDFFCYDEKMIMQL